MHTWCKEIDLKQYNPRNDIRFNPFSIIRYIYIRMYEESYLWQSLIIHYA